MRRRRTVRNFTRRLVPSVYRWKHPEQLPRPTRRTKAVVA